LRFGKLKFVSYESKRITFPSKKLYSFALKHLSLPHLVKMRIASWEKYPSTYASQPDGIGHLNDTSRNITKGSLVRKAQFAHKSTLYPPPVVKFLLP